MTAATSGSPARATAAQWVEGARPRTLPAAISPVVAATGLAAFEGGADPVAAVLALVVSLALQVGVNFANDYSDGIRGTDADRVGPLRLVGSGLARPAAVRAAAFASFAVAGAAGLVLVVLTGHWWLLAVGAASVLAAWYYTGGRRPYGYRGLGEAFVFVFFGLVAVGGTGYVQTGHVTVVLLLTGVWVGALTTAILVANNLRDLRGDAATGKLTLATRLGDRRTRSFYVTLVSVGALGLTGVAALTTSWALAGLLPLLLLVRPSRAVRRRRGPGPDRGAQGDRECRAGRGRRQRARPCSGLTPGRRVADIGVKAMLRNCCATSGSVAEPQVRCAFNGRGLREFWAGPALV